MELHTFNTPTARERPQPLSTHLCVCETCLHRSNQLHYQICRALLEASLGIWRTSARDTLNDFLSQISQMKNMGGLAGLMDKLPSQLASRAAGADLGKAERDVRRMEGIICSMTPLERRKPELIKASRKRRIATGAGVQVQEVNRMLNQFEQMRDMMKKMKGGGLMKMMKRLGGMKGMMPPGFPGA